MEPEQFFIMMCDKHQLNEVQISFKDFVKLNSLYHKKINILNEHNNLLQNYIITLEKKIALLEGDSQ